MRLWLKDSERRPDPVPVPTDDRKPMLVGLVAWAFALIAVLVFGPTLAPHNSDVWMWTCIAGLALGALGLVCTHGRRNRR